ncbi:MAG: low molecular weight phosphotyrosine protein phosphatase [Azospirillaceae bacterium]
MPRIVIVDAGNYSRSPAAERFLRRAVTERGLDGTVEIVSGGLKDKHVGDTPDPRTMAFCREQGLDLADFRCREIGTADFQADIILTMDNENLEQVRARRPDGGRAAVMRYLDAAGMGGDVPDPYYGDDGAFDRTMAVIADAADAIAARLAAGTDLTETA